MSGPFRPKIFASADLEEEGRGALSALGEVRRENFRVAMRLLTRPMLAEALKGYHVFITEIDVVEVDPRQPDEVTRGSHAQRTAPRDRCRFFGSFPIEIQFRSRRASRGDAVG